MKYEKLVNQLEEITEMLNEKVMLRCGEVEHYSLVMTILCLDKAVSLLSKVRGKNNE